MPITITNVSSPKYIKPDGSAIDLQLTTEERGIIPCTVMSGDKTAYTLKLNGAESSDITNSQLFANAATGQYGAVSAYVAPQAASVSLTFMQFMALFTSSEQAAFVNSSDTQIKLFLLMATGAGHIEIDSPEVAAGINYAVSQGILTSARAAQVLAGIAP